MCRTEYRNNSRHAIWGIDAANAQTAVTENLIEGVDALRFTNELNQALNNLNDEEKETFILRFQQEFSISEIAVMMDCPEGTVKSRIYYTTRKLATELHAFKTLLKQ